MALPGIKGRLLARKAPPAPAEPATEPQETAVTPDPAVSTGDVVHRHPHPLSVVEDDIDAVRAEAKRIGMKVDRRLGADRLAEQVEEFKRGGRSNG